MRKFVLVVLVLVAVAVGGYFGVSAYAQHEAERQLATIFQAFKADGIKASHGKVEPDLLNRSVTVSDIALAREDGTSTTTIGRVAAIGIGWPGTDRAKADRVELTDFAYDGPVITGVEITGSYRIPLAVVEHYEGPTRLPATGTAPAQMVQAFLHDASAKRVTMPSLAMTSTMGSGEDATRTEYRYGAMVLDELAAGKAAHVVVAPSTIRSSGPKDQAGEGAVDKVTVESLDLAANMGFLYLETEDAKNFQSLYGKLTIDGMTISDSDDGRIRIGTISSRNSAVRPSGMRMAEFLAAAKKSDQLEAAGQKPDKKYILETMDIITDMFESYRLGDIEISDVDITGKKDIQLRFKYFGIQNFVDGSIGNFSIDGLAITRPNGKLDKLEHFSLNGLKFSSLLRSAAEIINRDGAPQPTLTDKLKLLQFLEGVEIGGLDVAMGTSTDEVVKVETFQLSWGDFVGLLPSKVAASVRLSGPIALFGGKEPFTLLADSGKSRASLSFDAGVNWNESDKTITASPLSVKVDDAFSASAKLVLADVDKAGVFSADEAEAVRGLQSASLVALDITLKDAGIYQMKLDQLARDRGTTPEAAQEAFIAGAQAVAAQLVEDNPDLGAASEAVLDFLSAPNGTLTLKVTPTDELLVADVIDARNEGDLPSVLEWMKIEATTSH